MVTGGTPRRTDTAPAVRKVQGIDREICPEESVVTTPALTCEGTTPRGTHSILQIVVDTEGVTCGHRGPEGPYCRPLQGTVRCHWGQLFVTQYRQVNGRVFVARTWATSKPM